ncbi:MAG TPA: alcohol dehydrogenase catalytic domain-containing protein [Alphaproteobacteria bacterium]|nr:alcohol dehydrogenase catalytic domain-containing protein [Alphaproteobacteria bacterium]
MRAILKNAQDVAVARLPLPLADAPDSVVIEVAMAGLCRTDVFVAEGRIPCKAPDLVLGHEFAGIVTATGNAVGGIRNGDRVTVMPVLPCGRCDLCQQGRQISCQQTTMLGIDHHGAFSEYIRVPASSVYRIPDTLPFREAAYSEPVAAALSVMKSGIRPDEKGVIYGNNRFGQLIDRILKAYGFQDVEIFDPATAKTLPENRYDFAIETLATTDTMRDLFKMIRVGGRIVIKSRKHEPIGIVMAEAVRREITLSAVNYGDFNEAIDLMASKRIIVDDLLGDEYSLEDFGRVFERSKTHEARKVFFNPRQ